jgi:DNA-binding NarL/FixJ family response regulator
MEQGKRLCLLLVDDHQIVGSGILAFLASQPGIEVVGEASDGIEGIEKTRQLRPDVIIMDVNMPRMNGIKATRRIKSEIPSTRVIAFSLHKEADMSQAMHDAGADDYVTNDAPPDVLLGAICAGHSS